MTRERDAAALAAFLCGTLLGGGNAVGVRVGNRELDPTWGAGLRFSLAAVLLGEEIVLPEQGATWAALAYMVVLGSGPVFVLYVVVVRLWSASRAACTFVLIPVVTVLLSAWIDDEPIGVALVVGGVLVLAGVYVGALRRPAS